MLPILQLHIVTVEDDLAVMRGCLSRLGLEPPGEIILVAKAQLLTDLLQRHLPLRQKLRRPVKDQLVLIGT